MHGSTPTQKAPRACPQDIFRSRPSRGPHAHRSRGGGPLRGQGADGLSKTRTRRSEQAAEIVERLRAATPDGQTCSARLARWDFAEGIDDLLDRADTAIYAAKDSGRDRLVF